MGEKMLRLICRSLVLRLRSFNLTTLYRLDADPSASPSGSKRGEGSGVRHLPLQGCSLCSSKTRRATRQYRLRCQTAHLYSSSSKPNSYRGSQESQRLSQSSFAAIRRPNSFSTWFPHHQRHTSNQRHYTES